MSHAFYNEVSFDGYTVLTEVIVLSGPRSEGKGLARITTKDGFEKVVKIEELDPTDKEAAKLLGKKKF